MFDATEAQVFCALHTTCLKNSTIYTALCVKLSVRGHAIPIYTQVQTILNTLHKEPTATKLHV
jgi:hypothetical protein